MNILIIDTETTGLSVAKGDKLIEIGAILYSTKYKSVLQCFSTMFPCDENPVEKINGIKPEMTKEPMSHGFAKDQLMAMLDSSVVCVAHNAQFDKPFVETLGISGFSTIQWICTKDHFNWDVPLPRKRLQDICQAMGVNYINAHRALNDCMFMVDCFNKVENLEEKFKGLIKSVI